MKESIKDISLNPELNNIDEKPLGGKSLSSIMSKNNLEKPAKGLASLISASKGLDTNTKKPGSITQTKTQVTTEFYPSDLAINNEFLRIEREKNNQLNDKLEQILSIPQEVNELKDEITDLKSSLKEAINELATPAAEVIEEVKTEKIELESSKIKAPKKSILYAVISCTLILGMGLGHILKEDKIQTKIVEVKKEVPAVVKSAPLNNYVTTKFVNMRTIGSSKGKVILTVSPNQVLNVLEKKAGWWKVNYKNVLEDKTFNGWVYFENLKKIK